MGLTPKYEIDTTDYGTTGWQALIATAMEKIDGYMHTYLRYLVKSGETILAYDPVHLVNSQWEKAQANGVKQPAFGIAIESGSSGEYLRAQYTGPITNPAWTFSGSGEVYLGAAGILTQTSPGSNVEIVGYSISTTTILIRPGS
jgi:hypothetical protein